MYSSKSSFNFVSISVAVISIHRITAPADNSILFIATIISFLVFYSSKIHSETNNMASFTKLPSKTSFFFFIDK